MIKQLLAKAFLVFGVFLTVNANAQSTHTITVAAGGNLTFTPSAVTCNVGDTIRFFYSATSSGSHPTQSTSGPVTIPLHTLDATTNQYKVVMTAAGTVNYECVPHAGSGMTGTITVNAAVSNNAIITENFVYNVNDTLSNIVGAGWTPIATVSNVNKIPVVTPGLSYTGSTTNNLGNAVLIKNTGQDIGKAFPNNIRSGSIYTSFLINVSAAQGAGDYFFSYLDSALSGSNYRARTFIKPSGTGFRIGVSKSGSAAAAGYVGTDLNFGTTYQIVVKYVIVPGATNDSVKLYVDPVLGASEPAATASALVTENDITISSTVGIGAIALRQGGTTTGATLTMDGIKIGQTWASVTPLAVLPPAVSFNPTTLTVNENAGTATVSVSLANANESATSVDVVVKGGTATSGSDYTYTTQTVTFPANSTTAQTFTIPIIDDINQENDETIELVLRNNTNSSTITADSVLTITIPANDIAAPVVTFASPLTISSKEGDSVIFTINIANANATATSVNVSVASNSTSDASDYSGVSAASTTYTFLANSSTSITDTVFITNDATAESAETVRLILSNATNSALIGADSAVVITIAANDQPLMAHFVGTASNVSEKVAEASISIATMGATTSGSTSFDVMVKGGTATSTTDYTFTGTTVTIPGGMDSTVVVKVNIINDNLVEGDETVQLVLRNITNGGNITADSVYTLTIKSDDVEYKNISALRVNDVNGVSILKDSIVNIRGIVYGVDMQGSATSLQYTLIDPTGGVGIFRSGANNPPAITIVPEEGDSMSVYGKVAEFNGLTQVNMDSIVLISKNNALKAPRVITTLDESAESDLVLFRNAVIVDTIANTGSGTTIKIAAGTDTLDLRIDADVTVFGTTLPAKFNVVGLGGQFDNSNPKNSGYQLLPRYIADITAVVDPTVSLDSANYSVSEGTATKTIKVKLSTPSNGTTTVNIAATNGTATNDDYSFTSGLVTFAHGETEKSLDFSITNDVATETNETVLVTLSGAVNATLGTPSSATLTIIDNDPIGLNANKIENLNIYPNPAKDVLYFTASEKINTVSIINMMGQVVMKVNVESNEGSVNVSELSAGIYTVVVNGDAAQSTHKLIVK